MKKIVSLIGILLILTQQSWSQNAEIDKAINVLQTSTTDNNANLEKLKKLISDIEDQDKENIGSLILKDSVPIFNGNNSIIRYAKIEKVILTIQDGNIHDIHVKLKGLEKDFTNSIIIGITRKRFEDNLDRIFLKKKPEEYFVIQDLIHLKNVNRFVPEDILNFTYEPGSTDKTINKNEVVLYKNSGINSLFDVRLYSDLLSLLGDGKNGLAQTDLRFKQIIHRSNLRGHSLLFFQYFNVNFNYSKFDSKDEYVNVNAFSNTDLLKKRFVNAEIALNLIHGYLGYKSHDRYYLDLGAGVGRTKLVKNDADSLSVNNTDIFMEGGANFKFSSNGGVNVNIRAIKMFSPATSGYNEQLDDKFVNFMRYGVDLYWSPAKEKANRLFLRMNYIDPTKTTFKAEGFWQAQIGYSLMFSELINKK